MKKFVWLIVILAFLGSPVAAQTYEKIQGFCEKGGEVVVTDGRSSTTKTQRSYPSCTVQIFNGGTLVNASIASNSSGTPKSNPFTADSDGYWFFYALDGTYDVKMSGGGLLTPITRSGFWIVTSSGGGSGITGSGTTNRFPIFTSSSAIGNSVWTQTGTSEFGPATTGKRINLGTESQQVVEIPNASVGGTVQNRLAKLTGAPSTAITATTSDTSKIVGIVIANAGTAGNAQIVQNGSVDCEFDGATTAGNYVGASTTLAGRCKDLGSALPTSGVQVIGRVLETIGSAGNALVYTFTGEQHTSGLGGSGSTGYMAYWTSANTLAQSNLLYDLSGQILQSGYSFDIQNGGLSELTLETDQVIIKGGVNRATNAHVVQVKGVASQSGDYFRAIDSTSSTKFRIRSTGQPSFGGVNYTFPSLPATTSCLQISSAGVISTVSCQAANLVQAYNVNIDGGCANDGITNVTSCLATAIAAANSSGRPLYFPAGTYLGNLAINGLNSLKVFGDGPGRSIIQSALGTAAVIYANNSTGLTHSLTIEDLSLVGFGSGATDHGFYMTPDQPFDLTVRNVRITNTNGNGVYIPTNAFTMLFDGVDVSSIGGNGFDIYGDNTVSFLRTYVHSVGSGNTAYRLHSGRFILIGANGVDSGTNVSWGLFGDTTAEDGADAYARVALKGSNVEAWTSTSYGVRVKTGSQLSVENTQFITGTSITTSAILFDDADPNLDGSYVGRLDGLSAFTLGAGSAWTNSYPIRSKGIPFLMDGNRTASYYDTALAAAVLMPYQTVALNGASFRGATKFNRLALGTSTNEGFDGNLNFISDNTRDIGTPSAGRPANVYVGTKIQMATGTTTVQGQNWTITGGTSPLLAFDDGTITSRIQSLTATGLQFGTTSAHPINVLTNGTVTWSWESGGDFIVNTGSHNIGKAAGNRPVIGYFSTSVNPGTPGSTTGSIVFGNASNSFTTTIQTGVSAASRTYTWPTNFGAPGAALTDAAGNGTLSWVVPSTSPSLTSTYVGYGSGANVLTGTSDLAYSTASKTLTITSAAAGNIDLSTVSTNSAYKLNGATHPGSGGGLVMPFVGGDIASGPGIWWTSSGSYASTSGLFLKLGLNWQGASGHDNFKIRVGQTTATEGALRWDFQPTNSVFAEALSTSATGTALTGHTIDVVSTGTAAANFGYNESVTLENGSGSQVAATAIAQTWSVATAGSETGRISFSTNLAGAGVGEAFVIEGSQFYGTYTTANISGTPATINFNNGNSQQLTLTGNVGSTTLTGLKSGGLYFIIFKQDGTGGRTLASSNIMVSGADLTITSTATTGRTLFTCMSDGTSLYCTKTLDIR